LCAIGEAPYEETKKESAGDDDGRVSKTTISKAHAEEIEGDCQSKEANCDAPILMIGSLTEDGYKCQVYNYEALKSISTAVSSSKCNG
jgi:hypothetical protein